MNNLNEMSHPGILLKKIMKDRGVSFETLAKHTGHSERTWYKVVSGDRRIDAAMAISLDVAFAGRPSMNDWVRMQSDYDIWDARMNMDWDTASRIEFKEQY